MQAFEFDDINIALSDLKNNLTDTPAGNPISMLQLCQFKDPDCTWLVSIEFGFQVTLWEFRFSQIKSQQAQKVFGKNPYSESGESLSLKTDYRVELIRLSTITIRSDDHQPFCLTELRNKPPITEVELNGAKFEDFGDVILGCDSGTIIVLDVKAKSQSIAVVGNMQIQNA